MKAMYSHQEYIFGGFESIFLQLMLGESMSEFFVAAISILRAISNIIQYMRAKALLKAV